MMPQHLAGMPRVGPQEAIRRHPAGRAIEPGAEGQQADSWDYPAAGRPGPIGPDDDPDFLRELERRFRDGPERDGDL